MAKSASTIEINGNRYDAVSGQLIGAVKKVAAQVKSPAGGVIDGMMRRPGSARGLAPSKVKAGHAKSRITYKAPDVRQRVKRSQTLMRGAVKKPLLAAKNSENISRLRLGRVADISAVRAGRARTIIKNKEVEHFGKPLIAKTPARAKHGISPIATPRAAATVSQAAASQNLVKPLPSMLASVSHQNLERLLDHALLQADAHKQALRDKTKGWQRLKLAPKWLSVGASSLVVLLLAGFFAWQNIPQVSMRVAAARAHVSASVPAYTPSGFKLAKPITASDNKVTISYQASANSSDNFAITQQDSNWDSSSVAANAVPASSQVQTSQVNGTTVYIYGNSNDAKWVNHGVLFSLQDKANLSSDQILKIANGL